MGYRINKMIGYGLTDVVKDDPRINWESKLFEYAYDGKEVLQEYADFRKTTDASEDPLGWLEAQQVEAWLNDETRLSGRNSVQDAIQWGTSDYGLKNVLCIRPVTSTDWSRWDDMIDYVEDSYLSRSKPMKEQVKVIPHGFYPYEGWMDKRTGERVVGSMLYSWVRAWTNLSKKDKAKVSVDDFSSWTESFGMTGSEAAENVVPIVPTDVIKVAEFCDLFHDDTMWKNLRPMHYVWWA